MLPPNPPLLPTPISPTTNEIVPFRLLRKKEFFDTKTNIQATELAFSTTRSEGVVFPLCSSSKLEDILGLIHFVHQTVAPVFVPLRFVQLPWKQPRLQLIICSVDEFVTYFETWLVSNMNCLKSSSQCKYIN